MTDRRYKLRNTRTGEEMWVPSSEWQMVAVETEPAEKEDSTASLAKPGISAVAGPLVESTGAQSSAGDGVREGWPGTLRHDGTNPPTYVEIDPDGAYPELDALAQGTPLVILLATPAGAPEPETWNPHVESAALEHWIDFAQAEHDELWEGVDIEDIPDGFDYTTSAYLGLLLKWLEGIRDKHAARTESAPTNGQVMDKQTGRKEYLERMPPGDET